MSIFATMVPPQHLQELVATAIKSVISTSQSHPEFSLKDQKIFIKDFDCNVVSDSDCNSGVINVSDGFVSLDIPSSTLNKCGLPALFVMSIAKKVIAVTAGDVQMLIADDNEKELEVNFSSWSSIKSVLDNQGLESANRIDAELLGLLDPVVDLSAINSDSESQFF